MREKFQVSKTEKWKKSLTVFLEFVHNAKSFMDIQMRRRNRRRHYTSFWKTKAIIAGPEMGKNRRGRNILITYFPTVHILQPSSSLINVSKIR